MSEGLLAIISVVIGSILGSLSSFFITKQTLKHSSKMQSYPKQLEAIEFVYLYLFKLLSGEKSSEIDSNEFISRCLWLPNKERNDCLSILQNNPKIENIKIAQKSIIELVDKLNKGE